MREGLFDHHRLENLALVAAGGTPIAQAVLGPVPEGYAWYLEQAAYTVVGNSHTAAIDLAVTPDGGALPAQATWDHQGLVWTTAAAVRGSMQTGLAIYLGPGHFLHVYLSGGTLAAGDAATVTLQVAVHQLDPHFLMSPDDTVQVKEAHERMAAELNMDAVGERAN
jgi:hypothetical protein